MKTFFRFSVLSFSILLFSIQTKSQVERKTTYFAKEMHIVLKTEDGKEVSRNPLGVDIQIVYDNFFKSYIISYTDKNDNRIIKNFEHVTDLKTNDGIPFKKLKNEAEQTFYFVDLLESFGSLKIIWQQSVDDLIVWTVIENASVSMSEKSFIDYYMAGEQKMKLNLFSDAIIDFTKALQINPKHELSLMNRALCYMTQGKWQLAIYDCDETVNINPKQAVAFFVRGSAKINSGRSGCQDLRKSLELGYQQALASIKKYCK